MFNCYEIERSISKKYHTINDKNKDTGFEVGHILELIRDKCRYTTIKHDNQDPVKFTVDKLGSILCI